MKRTAFLFAVFLAACMPPKQTDNRLEVDVSWLKDRLNGINARFLSVYEELGKQMKDLNRRLAHVEGGLGAMDLTVADMSARLKAGSLSPADNVEPTPEPDEETIRRVELTLKSLQSGKIDETAAIRELLPISKVAAPPVVDELERNLVVPKYADKLEKVLATMPVESVRGPLALAVKKEPMRQAVSRIVGTLGDKGLSAILEEYVGGAGEDERMILAEALVRCKNPAGLIPLITLLRSEKWDVRTLSFAVLREINKGIGLDYNPRATPAENAAAIEQWEKWVREFGDKVLND